MKVIAKYFKIFSLIIFSIVYLLIFSVSCGASEEPNGGATKESVGPEEAACQQAVDGYLKAALVQNVDAAFKYISPGAYTTQEIADSLAEARQFYDGYNNVETTNFKIDESKDPKEAEYQGTVWYEGGFKGWIFADMLEEDGTWLIYSYSIDVEQAKKENYQN
jgi:hypothetical protein